ncbi:sugar ABC transporter substrate-binding protein [Aneurinibacillus tyrosinisolvens]|uniref:sugar ABC transporter substrate-binding protein n=1 Tax=Aneurinibacillus tyrosinisolvens TaxID=1443435 RepID=UPI00063F0844|nr:sugar ABC transporter substrate-binding protein [Aneurinibacillus tyrosinisolvens]
MKRIRAIFATSILGLGVLLSGCGSTSSEAGANQSTSNSNDSKSASNEKIKVGVVLKAANSEYWKLVQSGAQDAGKKYGAVVNVLGPAAETDVEKQVSMIEDQIITKVNAIAVAPSQPTAVLTSFEKAKQSNIPVVLIDSDADFPDKVTYVGTGNLAAGKQGGEFLASKLHKGDKVAIIRGALGDKTHDDRTKGAEEGLKAGGINVDIVQSADSDRAKALSAMENILQSNPDIKAVFVTNEEMALGALRAVQSKNSKIMVVGFDGTSEGLNSIKSGGLTAEVAQDPYMIGFLGVESAVKAVKGETVEKRIDSGAKIISKENAEEAITQINQHLGK